jgi:hypothetical protein
MDAVARPSRSKLWLGFGLMCVAVLVWVLAIKGVMGSVGSMPTFKPGASPAEMDAAIARLGDPMAIVTRMMFGYAVSGLVFVGGIVVTVMGLIDYAAEVRRGA